MPLPGDVLQAFAESFFTPDPPRESILQATQASLIRLVVGLSVGIVIGTLIGLAMAASPLVQRSIGSLMAGLQALPSISWLPLAILWFGLSERAILFVVIIATIPAMAIASAIEHPARPAAADAGRPNARGAGLGPATTRRAAGRGARLRRGPAVGVGARVARAHGRGADLDGRQGARSPARREPPGVPRLAGHSR